MRDGQKWRSWKDNDGTRREARCHHLSPREAPSGVRRGVVEGWFSMIAALRRLGAPWRANKLYGGFQMGLTRCLVRLSWEPWGSGPVLQVSAGRDQWFEVVGAAVSANGIPAVHLDTLQDVMDQAVVRDIMDA